MDKDKCDCNCDCNCGDGHKKWWKYHRFGGHSKIYPLGILGALFYFLPHASNLGEVIVGILKSIVWPALLVFKALELLKF